VEFKKILILQTAFLGDLVLTTPVISGLRRRYPDAVIELMTTPQGARLFTHDPRLNGIVIYDKRGSARGIRGWLKVLREVRDRGYDLAVVPHRSIRSALIPLLGGIPFRIGFDRSAGWFLHSIAIPYAEREHEVTRNLRLVAPLAPELEPIRPELFIPDEDRGWARRYLDKGGIDANQPFITVAPGSIWQTKRWTSEGYAELIARLIMKYPTVLIGGKEDWSLAAEIIASVMHMVENGSRLLNAVGISTPLQSAAIIARSRIIITNDSAPLHMGVAVGTPVCAIFGPTTPRFGFYPLGNGDRVVEIELPCRPCGIHGGRRCPEGHFRCMRDIRADEVYEVVRTILKEGTGSAG